MINASEVKFIPTLGTGASGSAYRVKWNGKDAIAHIYKVEEAKQEDFTAEATNRISIKHINIVEYFGIMPDKPGYFYLIYENLKGVTLDNLLKVKSEFLWEARIKIARDISTALAYLHGKGISHGSLHSGEVFIEEGVAKISGFGLESVDAGGIPLTYYPPERMQSKDSNPFQLDMWCIGVIFWEISSRQRHFENEKMPIQALMKISEGKLPDIPEQCPKVMTQIITECRKKPEERIDAATVCSLLQNADANL